MKTTGATNGDAVRTVIKGCKNETFEGALGILFAPPVLCFTRVKPHADGPVTGDRRWDSAVLEQHWFLQPHAFM